MNIHYKIVELWPDDHLIVARYWTDLISEESLASDANRKDDGTPIRCRSDVSINLPTPMGTTEEIENLVKINAPSVWLKMLEDVQNPNVNTALDAVVGLLGVSKTTNLDEIGEIVASKLQPKAVDNADEFKELSDDDIQKLIDAVSAKSN
jgi:hypothetical protein